MYVNNTKKLSSLATKLQGKTNGTNYTANVQLLGPSSGLICTVYFCDVKWKSCTLHTHFLKHYALIV